MSPPPQNYITYSNKRFLSYFQEKTFSLDPVLQIDIIVIVLQN